MLRGQLLQHLGLECLRVARHLLRDLRRFRRSRGLQVAYRVAYRVGQVLGVGSWPLLSHLRTLLLWCL
ncbi:hypothetical protein [Mumia zhuanghuii]|uniref:Uncharacterized protein n=1 Tax=Mumia zhuanghuii TaxID=2585211 RepID=A0A5C4LUW1_9ACTN|nr:hypothetical protein [Mumia zhuanghuii]TNC21774.1 hypothetical protein FHE65_36325 [Mumia zhuanghuii]